MKAFLTPTNEGQDLNYVEVVYGTRIQIEKRAKTIARGLQRLLPAGTFHCEIDYETGEKSDFSSVSIK